MRKVLIYLLLLTGLLFVQQSCKKNTDREPEPELPGDLELIDAKVILPQGSTYNLTGHEIYHHAQSIPVQLDGKTNVIKPNGENSIAYLLNKDGKPVMAGFVTDTSTTFTVETTAKVLLYFAMGIPFQEDTISHIFINRIQEVPGIADWINEFTTTWKSDPLTFHTGSYRNQLRGWLETRSSEPPAAGRPGTVNVNSLDVRSGLRLSPAGLGISFTNNYRRRVSVAFYKMKHKLIGSNNEITLLSNIGTEEEYERMEYVEPVSGITSFTGEVWKQMTDRGTESFAVTSGPFHFELADNETEVTYRARAIGAGEVDPAKLTRDEKIEYYSSVAYAVGMDITAPIIGSMLGTFQKFSVWNEAIEEIILVDFVKIAPAFVDNCLHGEFKKAAISIIDGLASEHGFEVLMKYVKAAYPPGEIPVNFESQVKKGALILQGIDIAMLAGDFIRIANEWSVSKGLEEWDFQVRTGRLTATPEESVVSVFAPSNKQDIDAVVQNLTTAEADNVEYEFTVAGNFGTLSDNHGQTGRTFKTRHKKVTFTSKNDPALTDGDNWESIYVTAYYNNQEIGKDTAMVNVKKTRYQLLPEGVTISGREGQTNSVNLRILPVSATGAPIPNNDFDYKIVWETAGAYGKLKVSGTYMNTVTRYNEPNIQYECTDDQTISATETVTAFIFAKKKGFPDGDYRLIDNIKVTIKINNDEKKIVKHLQITCAHGDTLYNNTGITCRINSYVMVDAVPNAKSYSVRFYNIRYPATYSWQADASTIPSQVPDYVVPRTGNSVAISYGTSWGVANVATVRHLECGPPFGAVNGGWAEVTILLR